MSRGGLTVLLCEFYGQEIKALAESGDFPGLEFSTFAARCGRPPLSPLEFQALRGDNGEEERVIIFGGCCLSHPESGSEFAAECRCIRLESCFHLVASPFAVNRYLQEGAYLVTPGWLQNWRHHLNDLGFHQDRELAGEFFAESTNSVILLDTGVGSDGQGNLEEFARFINRPFSTVPVGVELLRLRIENAATLWRGESCIHSRELLQRTCADYVMAFDLLDLIAQSHEEEEIVNSILLMFRTLFAATGVAFVRLNGGAPDKVTVQGEFEGSDRDELIAQAAALKTDYTLPPEMEGRFLFKVGHKGDELGIIIIDGLTLPKYREQYLSLALTSGELSGIIIKNARIFHELNILTKRISTQRDELQDAYSQLRDVKAVAFQQEKMTSIGQLAGGVAHEINSPLGFISSNLGTLGKYLDRIREFVEVQTDCLVESGIPRLRERTAESSSRLKIPHILSDSRQLIAESKAGADRVHKIIRELIRFAGADGDTPTGTDINHCLKRAITMVRNCLIPPMEIKQNCGELPPTLCYPQQLSQLFMNLLLNAIHALGVEGRITVSTLLEDETICVIIADTGCGIPEKNMSRIFDPFFTTREVGMGTGLGLSLAYDIVKRHKGEICATSVAGVGSTFTVRLPVTGISEEERKPGVGI